MKKLLITVVVLGIVGFVAYTLSTRQYLGHYGISAEHPLGEFEKLDRVLTEELKLVKAPLPRLDDRDIKPTARMFKYTDSGNRFIYLVLLLDNQSSIQGIAGWYLTPTHSTVASFMEAHWHRCGGPRAPQFTGYKMGAVSISEAEFTQGRVTGSWKRSKNEGSVPPGPTFQQVYLHLE